MMLLEAVVSYGDHFALYHLSSERQGVYHADLVKYYGSIETAPPKQLLLVRGVRKWLGHPNIPTLLSDIGQVIDSAIQEKEKIPQRLIGDATNPDL